MSGTNASPTLFGWDFQINAALVLMLQNIDFAEQVRVEGKTEDIEIKLSDGDIIYAQAKAVVKSSMDFSHVKSNLENALRTLSTASSKNDCRSLIYITNSPNPLGNQKTMSAFYGQAQRSYDSLSPTSKDIVDKALKKIGSPTIDTGKLSIHILPFETNNLSERYKVVKSAVDEFVFSIRPSLTGIAQEALDTWQKILFENATITDTTKVIHKKDFVWTLIVLMTNVQHTDDPITELMDEADYEELVEKYKAFINCKTERFNFATRLLTDYQSFRSSDTDTCIDFISEHWKDYQSDFLAGECENCMQENLIKVVLYHIIRQRRLVNVVKKKVKL